MYVEYGMACATSASGMYNLGGGVRGVRKSVHISPLPGGWPAYSGRGCSDVSDARFPPWPRSSAMADSSDAAAASSGRTSALAACPAMAGSVASQGRDGASVAAPRPGPAAMTSTWLCRYARTGAERPGDHETEGTGRRCWMPCQSLPRLQAGGRGGAAFAEPIVLH